jgi:hypothetical protein
MGAYSGTIGVDHTRIVDTNPSGNLAPFCRGCPELATWYLKGRNELRSNWIILVRLIDQANGNMRWVCGLQFMTH